MKLINSVCNIGIFALFAPSIVFANDMEGKRTESQLLPDLCITQKLPLW